MNRRIFFFFCCVVIYVLYTDIVHKMSLQREKEIEEKDFRLLKKKSGSQKCYLYVEMSGGDKLGFLKTDSLSVSKYINAFLCCLGKTQNNYIKSSSIYVYVGSEYVTLL